MTTWKEVKETWKELPKIEKMNIIAFLIGIVGCTILMLMGMKQVIKYSDSVTDEVKYFAGGIFITAAGFFVFNYLYSKNLSNRLDKHIKEEEKVKE